MPTMEAVAWDFDGDYNREQINQGLVDLQNHANDPQERGYPVQAIDVGRYVTELTAGMYRSNRTPANAGRLTLRKVIPPIILGYDAPSPEGFDPDPGPENRIG